MRSIALWLSLSVGMLCSGLPSHVQAASSSCASLFQSKQYVKAGQCFLKDANSMPPASQLSKIKRYLKGQTLRNAALAYQKAGDAEENAEKAAYRREQAVGILRRYLKENLCQKAYLCQQAKGVILELLNKIDYTQFTVITTPGKRAIIRVKGYQFKIKHISPPQWTRRVRPGRYAIEVKYENRKVIRKEVIVTAGTPRTETVLTQEVTQPKPPKVAKASPVPWIILGVGVAIAGTGGGLLGFGISKIGERDQAAASLANEASNKTPAERLTMAASPDTTARIKTVDDAHNTASTMLPIGWAMVGVGAATIITGAILFVVLRPKAPAKQALQPPHKQGHHRHATTSFGTFTSP